MKIIDLFLKNGVGLGELNPYTFVLNITEANKNKPIYLPIENSTSLYNYFYVDYGDGSDIKGPLNDFESTKHIYSEPGEYTVKIWGIVEKMSTYLGSSDARSNNLYYYRYALTEIVNWGNLESISYSCFCRSCTRLKKIPAGELPYPVNNTEISYSYMFAGVDSPEFKDVIENEVTPVTLPIQKIKNAIDNKTISKITFESMFSIAVNSTPPLPIINQIFHKMNELNYYYNIEDYVLHNKITIVRDGVIPVDETQASDLLSYIQKVYLFDASFQFKSKITDNQNKLLNETTGEQISSLVNQYNYYYTSDGEIDINKPCVISTYILPRHNIDDLTYRYLFFKFNSFPIGGDGFNGTYISTLYDKQYEIICEDISDKENGKLKKFDYKRHIESIDYYDSYGPKYISGSYNASLSTFMMKYLEINDIEETLVQYNFYNCIPISGLTYIKERYPDINTLDDVKGIFFDTSKNKWKDNTWKYNKKSNLNTAYKSYGFNNIMYMPMEEKIRFIIDNAITYTSEWIKPQKFWCVPKQINITEYTFEDDTKISGNDYLGTLMNLELPSKSETGIYLNDITDNVNIYYNTTKPITTDNELYVSIGEISLLSGYHYNIDINIPISQYLSSIILDENSYTRGINHLDSIIYKKYNGHLTAFVYTLGTANTTYKIYNENNIPYTNISYIPSTYILPSAITNIDYIYQGGYETKLESTTYKLKIPNTIASLNFSFYYSNINNGDYTFFEFPITNNNTNYSSLFNSSSISGIPIFNINTSKNITFTNTFYNCKNIIEIPIEKFNLENTSGQIILTNSFALCTNLKEIPLGIHSTTATMKYLKTFDGCTSLTRYK